MHKTSVMYKLFIVNPVNSDEIPNKPQSVIVVANQKMAEHILNEAKRFYPDSMCKMTIAYKYLNSDELRDHS